LHLVKKKLKSGTITGDILDAVIAGRDGPINEEAKSALFMLQSLARLSNNRDNCDYEFAILNICRHCEKAETQMDGGTKLMKCQRCKSTYYCSAKLYPLDGSSIVDNNWAVGTMMGIWPKSTGLIGATGRDQVTSLVALYGPRTTVLVALDDGTYEFSYGCTPEGCQLADGTWEPWICSRHNIKIKPDCKIFSPANLRAAQEVPGYKKLVDYYMENRYTLRYSGGLVPDVYQQFTKEQGVFSNPTSETSPAKLRIAFEAAPFGLLVEKAGGKTSDGVTGKSILDVQINSVDQRTALCMGSANEVDRFNEMVCSTK
jgi:fructose-1,6-bisphosphatase